MIFADQRYFELRVEEGKEQPDDDRQSVCVVPSGGVCQGKTDDLHGNVNCHEGCDRDQCQPPTGWLAGGNQINCNEKENDANPLNWLGSGKSPGAQSIVERLFGPG